VASEPRTQLPDGATLQTHFINVPHADLLTETGIGTQALFGQRFDLIRTEQARAYGALYSIVPGVERVDYIGTLPEAALTAAPQTPTHVICAVVAAMFKSADIKSKLMGSLPRNALIEGEVEGDFIKLRNGGFIHLRHIRAVSAKAPRSFTDIAQDMLGLPYIWGGTGGIGVDCSGLVQSALAATRVDAPRDTDQQEAALGQSIAFEDRQVGDLLFWPGHVGIVIKGDQLVHANAHHMCVAVEPVAEAVDRIGPVRTTKRL